MKKLIPSELKVRLRVWQRYLSDLSTGQIVQFAKFNPISDEEKHLYQPQITLSQALMPTSYSEKKKHNLALAIKRIQDVAIQPGEIFSFWHLVGKPDRAKGYVEGRSLVDNQLKAEVGGGLCQLSGLIYFLTLKAGLITLERHSHTHDIYTESTRFAPLGSDATIVYGYKDFRFQNNLDVPVSGSILKNVKLKRFYVLQNQLASLKFRSNCQKLKVGLKLILLVLLTAEINLRYSIPQSTINLADPN